MDGVSAGASVLAFVAAAVQTSRAIYNIVSSIRSGSPDIRTLACSASSLERALQQLLALLDSQSPLSSFQHSTALEHAIRQCAGDLDSICQQLGGLGSTDSVGPAKRAWRLVKVAIQKDDIQRMSRIIQHHVSLLTLQVVILSRCVPKNFHATMLTRPGRAAERTHIGHGFSLVACWIWMFHSTQATPLLRNTKTRCQEGEISGKTPRRPFWRFEAS